MPKQDLNEDSHNKSIHFAMKELDIKIEEVCHFIPQPFYYANLDGIITRANKAFADITNQPLDKLIGQQASLLFVEKEEAANIAQETINRGGIQALRFKLITEGNKEVPVSISTSAGKDSQGVATGYFALIELTEHQEAQKRIEQAAREWRATLDAIKDLVWICDKDCRLLRVNKAYADATGIGPKQVIGRICHTVFPWAKIACLCCPHKHAITTGESAIKEFCDPRQGAYLEISASPMFDENGKVIASVCVGRDVTEDKQAQKRIEQAARGWRATLDAIKDMVWICDKDCHLLRVNQAYANAVGVDPKQLIGKTCDAVFSWSKVVCSSCPHKRTIANNGPAIQEFYDPQQKAYLEISTAPIFDDKGAVITSVCVARDITKRKEAERIESELSVATEIQTTLLPRLFPAFPLRKEFDIFASMKPAKEVGGDFYDFFFIDENKFCFLIGDVSGKGIPAALFMAIGKTLLKTEALRGFSPDEILFRVNNILCPDNDTSMFITVFCATLNLETGELEFANGGHNPPLTSIDGHDFDFITVPQGSAIGVMPDIKFGLGKITLKPKDVIFAYTDGVTEAVDPENRLFSDKRLENLLTELRAKEVKDIVLAMAEAVETYGQWMPQADDITMLALEYKDKEE